MTIDTRHWGWCSLGPLAPDEPATLSDTYVQGGGGIIATRGTITLAGIYRPAVGTPVSLAISDGQGWIARVPRRVRVLSSTADPLRGVTTVSVGCLFTLYENRRPPDGNPKEAEENADVPEAVRRVAALPITAAWVTQRILTALGLTAAGPIPFTIARVVDEWDLSAGYVEELGRIAASEGYRCWINGAEQVAFIPLNQELAVGPLLTRAEIIDLTPVNVGDLPGEAIFANYSSLQLVAPDDDLSEREVSRRNWEREQVVGGAVQSIHSYTNAAGLTVKEFITYNDVSVSETIYDSGDRVLRRIETSNQLNGSRRSETTFRYASGFTDRNSDDYSRVLEESTTEWTPTGDIAAACGKDGPHADFRGGNRVTSWRVTQYDKERNTGITLTKTYAATAYLNTPFGSDAIAKLREAGEPLEDLIGYASRLTPYGSSTRIRTEREFGLQRRPGQQERNRHALAKVPNVEQTTKAVWALGSPAAEAAVDLSPPYVSDDRIQATGDPPAYTVVPSGAEQQALSYARIENRLLLGHRSGIGLQLAPIDTPAVPFSLFYVRLNGCTAAYRSNGTTWTIGSDGVVCSTDALFWGAIDGTASDAWFPLPPGVTTLPGAVAVTTNANPRPANAINIPGGFNPMAPDLTALFASLPTTQAATPRATVNPAVIVRPWNETIPLRGGACVGAGVRVQTWLASTLAIGGGVRVGGGLRVSDLVIGTAQIGSEAYPVLLDTGEFGGSLAIGTAGAESVPFLMALTQAAGPIVGDLEVSVGTGQSQSATTLVQLLQGAGPITGDLEMLLGTAPSETRGQTMNLTTGTVTITDPTFSSNLLLLHFDGGNGSQLFVDSSNQALAPTVVGDSSEVLISTAQSVFGGASGRFNGGYLRYDSGIDLGGGTATIEMRVRRTDICRGCALIAEQFFPNGAQVGFTIGFLDGTHTPFAGTYATYNGITGWIRSEWNADLDQDEWYALAGVFNGSTWTLLVNGVPAAPSAATSIPAAVNPILVGRRWDSGTNFYFRGYIDELRVKANQVLYTGAYTPSGAPFPDF